MILSAVPIVHFPEGSLIPLVSDDTPLRCFRVWPALAPAYDLLSTLACLPHNDAALNFHQSRAWSSFTYDTLEVMAARASLPSNVVIATAKETVKRFDASWASERPICSSHRQSLRPSRAPEPIVLTGTSWHLIDRDPFYRSNALGGKHSHTPISITRNGSANIIHNCGMT